MAAPTFINSYNTVYNTTTSPKSVSVTTQAGDILVVCAGDAGSTGTLGTPSGNSVSFNLEQHVFVDSQWSQAKVWTGTDTTGGTNWTLQVTHTSSAQWGFTCYVFRNAAGIGASSKTNVSGATPSLDITTTRANSAVVVLNIDWDAQDGSSRTWRTVNSITPSSANGLERAYYYGSGIYTFFSALYDNAGSVGAKTVGLTAPGSQKYSIIALEILGSVTGPIAEYSFESAGSAGGTLAIGGTIPDTSGNGNTLTVIDSDMSIVSSTSGAGVGVVGNGLTSAQVSSTNAIKPTTAVTWMCWAKVTGNTYSWGQIFGRCNDDAIWGEAFSFYMDQDNNTTYRFRSTVQTENGIAHTVDANTVFTLNTWVHIAATWSSADGNTRVFINGSQVASSARDGTMLHYGSGGNTTDHFNIFLNEHYTERGNQIQIDEVRVFNYQLSGSEITTWMNTHIYTHPTTPLMWVQGVNS